MVLMSSDRMEAFSQFVPFPSHVLESDICPGLVRMYARQSIFFNDTRGPKSHAYFLTRSRTWSWSCARRRGNPSCKIRYFGINRYNSGKMVFNSIIPASTERTPKKENSGKDRNKRAIEDQYQSVRTIAAKEYKK